MLTVYDGKSITYDAIGNPLSDGTWSYTWVQGRQLSTMTAGSNVWNFTYDANGMRTKRTNQDTVCTYEYNGSQLSHMTYGNIAMRFTYAADGTPLSIVYNGTTYYYATNLQGDVVAILSNAGNLVVEYYYDGWGRLLSTSGSMASSLGFCNPLRYRGYVYNREIGMYYLQSRYYNPETGRFLNADASTYVAIDYSAVSCNLFTYCKNTPTTSVDAFGFNSAVIAQGDTQWVYMLASIVPAVAAAKAGIVAAIKSALAFLWNVFVVVGLFLLLQYV